MTKPDWKTKPHERKRMTLQQENQALKERIKTMLDDNDQTIRALNNYREEANLNSRDADRYRVLKNKDVMVLDGEPKYLKGKDLDEYCDEENSKFWGTTLASASLSNMLKRMNGGTTTGRNPTKMIVPMSYLKIAEKLLKEERDGNDTGSKSKEADQKDSGHHTDILRYADWNGLWKQRSA